MTTTTFYATNSGMVQCSSGTYANAADGSGSKSADFAGADMYMGQYQVLFTYQVYQSFLEFDTSSIPDSATITSVVVEIYFTNNSGSHIWRIGTLDWPADAGAFIPDYQLGSTITTLGKIDTATDYSGNNAYSDFIEIGDGLKNSINKTGYTKYIIWSDEQEDGVAPVGSDYGIGKTNRASDTSQDPKVTITYSTLSASQNVSGSISPTGILTKTTTKSLTGTSGAMSGALNSIKGVLVLYSGSLPEMTGQLTKTIYKSLSGSLSPTGLGSKTLYVNLSGVISLTGKVVNNATTLATQAIKGGYAIINRMRGL